MERVSLGRLASIAVALSTLAAAAPASAEERAGVEVGPAARETVHAATAAEPGSSEADFAAAALRAAKPAARLRPFDAEAHERDKRAAPNAREVAAAKVLPALGGASTEASVSTNFGGLTRPTAVNNGFVFFPPDTHMAKSPNRVIEVVNSAIRLSTNVGGNLGTTNLNTFFGAAVGSGLVFDPKVIYDRNAVNQRFYVVALQKAGDNDGNLANDVSRIWVAVSRAADPGSLAAASWCRYNLEGRRDAGTVNASWADYPGIGNGFDALLLSFNQFGFAPPRPFKVAQIKAIRKIGLANNAASCPVMTFFTFLGAPGSVDAFTLQPVHSITTPSSFAGTTNPAYLVSNRATSPSGTSRLWRIRNVAGAAPTMSFVSFAQAAGQTTPPDARQPGTALLLDTGDPRLLSAASAGNSLSVVHATGCQFAGGGSTESCINYRRLNVGQSGAGSPTVAVAETQIAGFNDNTYVYWPSVAVLPSLRSVSAVQVSTPTTALSTVALVKAPGALWSSTFTTALGTCGQTLSNRAGDYTGTVVDTGLTSFWVAGERALSISGSCQWDTRIARILVP